MHEQQPGACDVAFAEQTHGARHKRDVSEAVLG
jgi:hypothetical protein